MAAAPSPADAASPPAARAPRLRHRAAYLVVAALLLFIVALLPFAVGSLARDFRDAQDPPRAVAVVDGAAVDHANVAVDLIGMNEWAGTVTVRVTAQQECAGPCRWRDRYRFISIWGGAFRPSDRPTVEAVTVPESPRVVTRTFDLPIAGDPLRYPFDRYALALGIAMDRLHPDGREETLTLDAARDYLTLWASTHIPRVRVAADPSPWAADGRRPYLLVDVVRFTRPLYLQVLTVFLVLLVAAAAAYAVLLRPLDQLVINAGALILGVWGIRSILLGSTLPGLTAVDLALWSVILFLLVTITVRTLWLLEADTGCRPLRAFARHRRPDPPPAPPAPRPRYIPDDPRDRNAGESAS